LTTNEKGEERALLQQKRKKPRKISKPKPMKAFKAGSQSPTTAGRTWSAMLQYADFQG
jgi:hypothetical protein